MGYFRAVLLGWSGVSAVDSARLSDCPTSSIPTAPTKHRVFASFCDVFNNKTDLTTIEPLLGRELSDAGRAKLNRFSLLIPNHVAVDSQRDSRVTVPQLPLHHSRSCTVCKQGTGRTVPHRMEPAAWNAKLHQKRVKLLFTQFVC